jgi:hypothetical protein
LLWHLSCVRNTVRCCLLLPALLSLVSSISTVLVMVRKMLWFSELNQISVLLISLHPSQACRPVKLSKLQSPSSNATNLHQLHQMLLSLSNDVTRQIGLLQNVQVAGTLNDATQQKPIKICQAGSSMASKNNR